jgi:predicted metal-binding membrane protein
LAAKISANDIGVFLNSGFLFAAGLLRCLYLSNSDHLAAEGPYLSFHFIEYIFSNTKLLFAGAFSFSDIKNYCIKKTF